MGGENLGSKSINASGVDWGDDMNQFLKYVETVNKKRAEAENPDNQLEDSQKIDWGEKMKDLLDRSVSKDQPADSEKVDWGEKAMDAMNRAANKREEGLDSARNKELEFERARELERKRAEEELKQVAQEMAKLEQKQIEDELKKISQEKAELEKKYGISREQTALVAETPLVAINLDWSHDEKELSHDLAEQTLNAEVADARGIKGIIKGLWKGTLFKKYFEKKYEKEFLNGERKDENGKTIKDLIHEQKQDVITRFTLGTLDEKYVHGKAGEELEKADEETNEAIKTAISGYAHRAIQPGENLEDLDRDFKNEIDQILNEAIKSDKLNEGARDTDYLALAKRASALYEEAINRRAKAEHETAMDEVMAGFQVYNAKVRNGVRTEAHRDSIDKIVNALESSKIGQFIPAEILAGATGIVFGLTQTGARAIFGAAGGILASSAISGLKERNRITEDRARMMRDIANGMDYGGNKKTAKYETRIGGTLYDMRSAKDLTKQLRDAFDSTDEARSDEILRAIAEARVRIDFSDSEQKDLICYSSTGQRGKERLELDIAVIRAEKSLSEEGQARLEAMKKEIERQIVEGYDDEAGEHHAGVTEKDQEFKRFRAISAIKKAGKTLALGSAIFIGSQEVRALLDPNKIGIFEKAGIIPTNNNGTAEETLLASGFGRITGNTGIADLRENISDPSEIKRLEEAGYTKVQTAPASTTTAPQYGAIDPSASTAKASVKYDGWANDGTKLFYNKDGFYAPLKNDEFIANMPGAATMPGQKIDYLAKNAKAFITIGDNKFEVLSNGIENGQITWGKDGFLELAGGGRVKVIGDNGEKLYKYFEIAMKNGTDANGVEHIIPLATDVGANTFNGKIEQVISKATDIPATYTLYRGIDFSGIGFAPETARTGLGRAMAGNITEEAPGVKLESEPETKSETEPETEPENTPESEPTPENAEEPTSQTLEEFLNSTEPGNPTNAENASEGQAETPEDKYMRAVYEDDNVISPELLTALTEPSVTNPTPETQRSWGMAINELSPAGKAALKKVFEMRRDLPEEERNSLDRGKGFYNYLVLNPDILQ